MSVRILHICISDGGGGAAIAANRLNDLMNKNEVIDSNILVLINSNGGKNVVSVSKAQLTLARVSNRINNLITKNKKSYGLFSFAYLGLDLSKHELVKNANIIYVHWINNGMMSWENIDKIISLQKPILLFSHDMWYFTGGCHQSNGCEQYKTSCQSCVFFESAFMKNKIKNSYLRKKKTYAKYSNVNHIFPSTIFHNMAIQSNIAKKEKLHYISNILDTEKFVPKKVKNKKKIRLLYGAMGGKSNLYKGWDHFEYLLNNIVKDVIEDIEILLFGYDFKKKELNQLRGNVKSYGTVYSEEKMIEIYQNADIFIFPSSQESFGQTLFEAMACGVIPIAYDVGASRDLIKHGESGYLLSVGDKKGLVDSFHKLVEQTDLSLIKRNVRKRIEEKFSSESVIEKHMKLLKKIS